MKILIAEDDPTSALFLERVLTKSGYQVVVAEIGRTIVRMSPSTRGPCPPAGQSRPAT